MRTLLQIACCGLSFAACVGLGACSGTGTLSSGRELGADRDAAVRIDVAGRDGPPQDRSGGDRPAVRDAAGDAADDAADLGRDAARAEAGVTGGGIPLPGTLQGLVVSGPIAIDGQSGVVISGKRVTNPSGHCIVIRNASDVRVTGNEIGPCGDGSDPEQNGVMVFDSATVAVDHNVIHDVASGVFAVRATGMVVSNNHVSGVRGPMPRGQIVQFDSVHGAGNKVLCNIGDNKPTAGTEDSINMWKTQGTPSSYVEIAYNRLRGGHSPSGSGILVSDGGSEYIDAHDNTVTNVNNVGIAVAGGNHTKMRNNRVYNDYAYSSVGMSVRSFYGPCSDVTITGNRTWAFDRVWNQPPAEWHFLDTGECTGIQYANNVWGDTALTVAIFDEPYLQCE